MHVDGDEGLVLCPFNLLQVSGRHVDEDVEKVEELLVCVLHHLLVGPGVGEGVLGIPRPDHLDTQQANLHNNNKVREVCKTCIPPNLP